MSWPDKNPQEAKKIQISLSAATDDVGEWNPSIFTQKINIRKITTMQQRHDKIEAELKEFLMPIESPKLLFRSNWHRYKNAPTNCPNDVPRVAGEMVLSQNNS
ncbi:uncharacterized protein LOC129948074 [Eupeodes corollae]|uniref:uncharacterized protein LOC129948074 n=1 Tax=Eupeodes corollae TaxID=290404 RepID=UPI0024932A53|nr:uncharacterized protein LOC129948074 [Eupeodes corollae]